MMPRTASPPAAPSLSGVASRAEETPRHDRAAAVPSAGARPSRHAARLVPAAATCVLAPAPVAARPAHRGMGRCRHCVRRPAVQRGSGPDLDRRHARPPRSGRTELRRCPRGRDGALLPRASPATGRSTTATVMASPVSPGGAAGEAAGRDDHPLPAWPPPRRCRCAAKRAAPSLPSGHGSAGTARTDVAAGPLDRRRSPRDEHHGRGSGLARPVRAVVDRSAPPPPRVVSRLCGGAEGRARAGASGSARLSCASGRGR